MPGDEAAGGWALALGGLMWVAVVAQCVIVARQRTVGRGGPDAGSAHSRNSVTNRRD